MSIMNYEKMNREISSMYSISRNLREKAIAINEKLKGKRNVEAKRVAIITNLKNFAELKKTALSFRTHESRYSTWKSTQGKELAEKTGYVDEHGSSYSKGDYLSINVLDFKLYKDTLAVPYCNMSKDSEGMAVVEITRKRVYAKSSNWGPSYTSTKFLVGQNEAGTYFSHPVSKGCNTLEEALNWMWTGKSNDIIQRQGDIALIKGKGIKLPELPNSHIVCESEKLIKHNTHPSISLPKKGERIIVAKRATEKSTAATRD